MKSGDAKISVTRVVSKTNSLSASWLLTLLLLLSLTATVQSQDFFYRTNHGKITITGNIGSTSSLTIPSTIHGLPVTCIGDDAFKSKSMTSVIIPDSITTIDVGAFCSCGYLTNVAIPNRVTSIGGWAFFGCSSLTSVAIPESVNAINGLAFGGCGSLILITVNALNSSYSSWGGVLFNKDLTTLIQYPGGKAGSYRIPNSVTSIGDWAFFQCTKLTSVTIPNSVTNLGDYSFHFCTNLRAVVFQGNAPSLNSRVFDRATHATVYYLPGTKGWGLNFGGRPTALYSPPPVLAK